MRRFMEQHLIAALACALPILSIEFLFKSFSCCALEGTDVGFSLRKRRLRYVVDLFSMAADCIPLCAMMRLADM